MRPATTRYRSITNDTARWTGFPFREGDIVISTPPKCGTTWLQTIIALLVFQTTKFHAPVDRISLWVDQTLHPLDQTIARLEAQTHRRFMKSHAPLDGLPFDERVTYITIARDPRDVAISWDHHAANLDFDKFMALRSNAVGLGDVGEFFPNGIPQGAADVLDRFWEWMDMPLSPDIELRGLASAIHVLETFFDARNEPNVILLHYQDLEHDLQGQMRALAARLGLRVPEALWPELVKAATFDEMKSRAAERAPNSTDSIWRDPNQFFHSGQSGQWKALLDEAGVRRYAARARELATPALSAWLHRGPL